MSSATTKRPAKRTPRKIPAERKNPMLDSVRSRMTLWYSGLLGLFLVVLAGLTYFLYWHNSLQSTDSNLLELSDTFVTTFNAELKDATGDDPRKEAARVAMIEHRFRDVIFAIVDDRGRVILSSLDLPVLRGGLEHFSPAIFASKEFLALAHSPTTASTGTFQNVPGGKNGFRGYSRLLEPEDRTVSLVILQSLHPQKEIMEDIRHTFYWIIPIALLLASAGGYFLARKSLAPVTDMATQARGMGAARLSERLEVSNPRDELRTPVAILQGETEVTLSRPDRPPEEYRETLAILRDESHRLAHIIEDLFTLTRADAGQYPLKPRDLYLDELASDVLRRTRSLAIAKGVTLTSSIQPELPLHADEDLLRRMLLNLLDNAIKYTPAGGMVNVDCRLDTDSYVVRVSNTGPGIPTDLQSRIFERFFRADKARSRSESDTGGAGLGLSIARWIAEAHHGRLELTQSDSSGTTFTAYLPVPNRNAISG